MGKLLINLGILCLFLGGCIVLADSSLVNDDLTATTVINLSGIATTPSFDCANVTDVSSGECQSLADLYIHTHGEAWKHANNWLGSGDSTITTVCDWYGVRCDNGLYLLDLIENNLSGTIPTSFRNLSGFYFIYLRGNSLTSIESGAFKSSHLRELSLFNNKLTEITDKTFSELDNLQELLLSYNYLSTLPNNSFSHLHTLITLDIGKNQLHTIEPNAFVGLNSLSFLFLSDNQLTGISASLFSGLSNLYELYLSYNQLSWIDPNALSGLTNLAGLYLSNNWLNSLFPPISSVQSVDLRYNCLGESLFDSGALSPQNVVYSPQSQSGCNGASGSTPPEEIIPTSSSSPSQGGGGISYGMPASIDKSLSSMDTKTMWLLLKKHIPNFPSKWRFERLLAKKTQLYSQILSFLQKNLRQ